MKELHNFLCAVRQEWAGSGRIESWGAYLAL
jgi:hypothetical protein